MQNLSPRAVWLYPMRLDDRWTSLLPASLSPAHRPHCQFVFLRSKVCYALLSASPRGYALRFATVTIIGSGWLLSLSPETSLRMTREAWALGADLWRDEGQLHVEGGIVG